MDESCPFCAIIEGREPAYKLFESEHVIAILDIQPLRNGHVLVIPKTHVSLFSELPDSFSKELGSALRKISHAISSAFDNPSLTITLNQVYAQVVPHVHFHVVPAPNLHSPSKRAPIRTGNGLFGQRDELDENDATEIVERIKSRL